MMTLSGTHSHDRRVRATRDQGGAHGALYPWLFSHTRAEATAIAQAAGWPFVGVNTPNEVLGADHFHQRGFWQHVKDPDRGDLLLPSGPYRHGEGGWQLRDPAPRLDDQPLASSVPPPALSQQRASSQGRDAHSPPLLGDVAAPISPRFGRAHTERSSSPIWEPRSSEWRTLRCSRPPRREYVPRPAPDMQLGPLLDMYADLQPGQVDRPYNRHAMNNSIARNKLSCTLDPRRPEARELLMRLAERSDVLVENLKTTTLHQLGIHESVLMDRNPRMIVLRMPPAGLTGDWAEYTGFGAQFDGLSGFAYLAGHYGSEMVETPSTMYMDAVTGPAGAFAILAALHYRETTGRGQVIELAQMENVLNHMGDILVDCQRGIEPRRMGNRDPLNAPQGIYPCRGTNRWLGISVEDGDQWTSLVQLMGRQDLASDIRFTTSQGRFTHQDEIDEAIRRWTATQDPIPAFHALQSAGIPAGPQLDNDLLSIDPHVSARGWIRPLTTPDVGTHLHIGHTFIGIPQTWWRGSPSLGGDNEYVFRKLLGLDAASYEGLVTQNIVASDYLDPDGNPV